MGLSLRRSGYTLPADWVQSYAMTDSSDISKNPWEWPETQWRRLAARASEAAAALVPQSWPPATQPFAVGLSFDSDHQTNELREGGQSISRLSMGEFGARRGIKRIMAILEREDVPASFYVPAVSALLHPDEQKLAALRGHEIGLHGWIHELNNGLMPQVEHDLMLRAADGRWKSWQASGLAACARRPGIFSMDATLQIAHGDGPSV